MSKENFPPNLRFAEFRTCHNCKHAEPTNDCRNYICTEHERFDVEFFNVCDDWNQKEYK
jgi:hypothetical protein